MEKQRRSHPPLDVDVEDIGVFEWIAEPGEEPAFVESPAAYIATRREKIRRAQRQLTLPVDRRVRWEVPALMLWVVLTALLRDLLWWAMLALALIAFAAWVRPALERRYIVPLAFIYGGIGVGQLLFVTAQFLSLEALRTGAVVYGLLLLLIWMSLEVWYLILSGDETAASELYYQY